MKRVIWPIPAILVIIFNVTAARAQEVPEWEVSGGYSYLRADVSGSSFHFNGGSGSLGQNVNKWFGGRFECGAFSGTESHVNVSSQTYTSGPVFSTHRYEKITPYFHVQFGAIHASRGYLGISRGATKFAMAPGIGVDLRTNDRAAVRVQADYLMSRFLNLRQDNVQGSVGLVLRFGTK